MIHDPDSDSAADADSAADISDDTTSVLHHRRIRSFVTRAGRVSTGQRRALDEFGPRFVLPFEPKPLNWENAFERSAPHVLEIGFGMGGTTAEIAATRASDDFLGVEVHEPGVGALLKLIDEHKLTNIRIVQHDAVEVLEQMIAESSLDGVHIYFPDPWHKARHHKRRLIQPKFVSLLVSRLKPGGYLHLATDWQNYAEQMLEVLSAESALENTAKDYAPRPAFRPVTKFERRGLKLGHGVWDLMFKRR
jgi:tRNA (guanine-N7-)-methyltransferase